MERVLQALVLLPILGSWVVSTATGASFASIAWTRWSDSNLFVRLFVAGAAFSIGSFLYGWVLSVAMGALQATLEELDADDHRPLGKGLIAWSTAALTWGMGLLLTAASTYFIVIAGKTSWYVTALTTIEAASAFAAFGFIPVLCSASITGGRRASAIVLMHLAIVGYVVFGSLRPVLEPNGAFSGLPTAIASRVLLATLVFGTLVCFANWRYRRERAKKLRPAIDGLRAKRELLGELTAPEVTLLERLTAEYVGALSATTSRLGTAWTNAAPEPKTSAFKTWGGVVAVCLLIIIASAILVPQGKDNESVTEAMDGRVRKFLQTGVADWTPLYSDLVRATQEAGDHGLGVEYACKATMSCLTRLKWESGTLSVALPVPDVCESNGEGRCPENPLLLMRDSNRDGWPEAFSLTDAGRPWGECYESERAIGDGFCALPLPGEEAISGPYTATLGMWFLLVDAAISEHIKPSNKMVLPAPE